MSSAASRRQHKRFCDAEGWDEVTNARGKAVGHHITYELPLSDGRILRTRVSRPANNDTYGASLWSAILRDQLQVTESQFWDCVDRGVMPPRPAASASVPSQGLPASLAFQLIHTLGLPETEVAGMSKEDAVLRMTEYWSKPPE